MESFQRTVCCMACGALSLIVLNVGLSAHTWFAPRSEHEIGRPEINLRSTIQDETVSGAPVVRGYDPDRVIGERACADCHRREFEQWRDTEHFYTCYEKLFASTPRTLDEYSEAIEGLTAAEITRRGQCIDCHSPPYGDYPSLGSPRPSVTCEVCHNPAGGDEGWLLLHADYGFGKSRLTEDKNHRDQRINSSRQVGLIGANDTLTMMRRCADCHIATRHDLFLAGHKQEQPKFELDSFIGKIRHNFHVDGSSNPGVSSIWLEAAVQESRDIEGRLRYYSILMDLVAIESSLPHIVPAVERLELEIDEDFQPGDSRDDDEYLESHVKRILDAAEELGSRLEEIDEFKDPVSALSDLVEGEGSLIEAAGEVIVARHELALAQAALDEAESEDDRNDAQDDLDDAQDNLDDAMGLLSDTQDELADYHTAFAESQQTLPGGVQGDIWSWYRDLFRWGTHFDTHGARTILTAPYDDPMFAYEADGSTINVSYDVTAFQSLIEQLTPKIEEFADEHATGEELDFFEAPEVPDP